MMIVGLTGGIGSGKSTVANYFKALGVPVIDADDVTRDLVKPGTPVLAQIVEHFGKSILTEHGELDRPKLRKKIFSEPRDKIFIENLLHPLVVHVIKAFAQQNSAPYIIATIPLLIEGREKHRDLVNKILVVDAPEALQISRVKHRDKFSTAEIKKIMMTQVGREERLHKANDVIVNDGDLEKIRKQVIALDAKYRTTV